VLFIARSMTHVSKAVIICAMEAALALACYCQTQGQRDHAQRLNVQVVGFADRWANYGSRGDTPSFRDFLAVIPPKGKRTERVFIKLRFLYFPQDNDDPKSLAETGRQQRKIVNAVRDSLCDETFANLSRSGEIEFLDPELKPSQFVVLHGDVKGMPANEGLLPCYVVY
jgi:hypothetical protein